MGKNLRRPPKAVVVWGSPLHEPRSGEALRGVDPHPGHQWNRSEDSGLALEHAAMDLPSEDLIDRISYIAGVLADGVALNWHTYGDRSRAIDQMDLAESVLDAWLRSQLEPSAIAKSSTIRPTSLDPS
jgi:hypothetical protein